MFCQVSKYRIYYRTVGTGKPILTLHGGLGYDHHYMYNTTRCLHGAGKWIFWDYPAHGRSTRRIDKSEVSVDNIVTTARKLCRELGVKRPILFGHSYGGSLALAYAIKYPLECARLILICPALLSDSADERKLRQKELEIDRRCGAISKYPIESITNNATFSRHAFACFPIYFHRYSKGLSEYLQGSRPSYRALQQGEIEAANAFPDIVRGIPKIKRHVYAIFGKHDAVVGLKNAAIMRNHISGKQKKHFKIIIFNNSAHFPHIEEPDKFRRILMESVCA